MAEYAPVHDAGAKPGTKIASAAVTGGRLVEQTTAGRCAHAAAGSTKVIGVAAFDAAINVPVTIWPISNLIHEIESAGAINVGDGIQAAASGLIATGAVATLAAAGTLLGIADSAAAGAGTKTRFTGRS
jgi:hypothetical protein